MGERYTRLFSLPENLYSTGAPVIIAAGALLKDNQTGNVLAQLKLRSVSANTIKAATVSIKLLDTVGLSLGDCVTYQYLDLQVDRDADFGQRTAIPLPNPATRSFGVIVTEAIFTDNSIWHGDDQPWEALAEPTDIDFLGDKELTNQFRMEYGGDCKNLLLEQKNLWHCICGAINHREEMNCHVCNRVYYELLTIDLDNLQKKKAERLAEERVIAEKRQAVEEAKRVKWVRNRKIVSVVAIFVIAAILVAILFQQVIIPGNRYNDALVLMETGQYEEAVSIFEALGDYKDSTKKINECDLAIVERKYDEALNFANAGQYEKAIVIFKALGGFRDSIAQIDVCNTGILYDQAVAWDADGNVIDAYEAFISLGNYKDSADKAKAIHDKYRIAKLKAADIKVGDHVFFGSYEQNSSEEGIEWLVLKKEGRRILVLSEYALTSTLYNQSRTGITWENCWLRQWLNDGFLNAAFSDAEQSMIPTVAVSAGINPNYDTDPGNATMDQIFLLNIEEVDLYLTSSGERQCSPTQYAANHGIGIILGTKKCDWLLRSPGMSEDRVGYGDGDGLISYVGDFVDYFGDGIRPAMWIDLGK